MTNNPTAEDMELTAAELQEYNYYVGMKQALDRLEANPDFKTVVLDGYFKDRAINAVGALASDNVRRGGHRPELMEELNAISMLQQYFITLKKMGAEMPEDDMDEDEEVEG